MMGGIWAKIEYANPTFSKRIKNKRKIQISLLPALQL